MQLITSSLSQKIERGVVAPLLEQDLARVEQGILKTLDRLHANIPDRKRISYGIVYVIKVLSRHLNESLCQKAVPSIGISQRLFSGTHTWKCQAVALGIMAATSKNNCKTILPFFQRAAGSTSWELREMAQMFFRPVIKHNPERARLFLLKQAQSKYPNLRRFVGETLRPVQENQWFFNTPDYSLSILTLLFQESNPYARTSVGNNLSDLSRRLPHVVYSLAEKLVQTKNEHSYWIAYRACRNLVKANPCRVMNLLGADKYRYKYRHYKRNGS